MIKKLKKLTPGNIFRVVRSLPKYMRGYYQAIRYNRVSFQKVHWEKALAAYDWNADRLYGYDWGDPENPQDKLGNYLEVKNRLLSLITPQTTIVEIGSLGGKWTQYLISARKVICVDINETCFKYIRKKLPYANIEFYLSKGHELKGIKDNSVDVVFSMDALPRAPKRCISGYFREINRVLKESGRIFLHLPCTAIPGSKYRMFVPLSLDEITILCEKNNLGQVSIDQEVLKHGVIVEAVKASS